MTETKERRLSSQIIMFKRLLVVYYEDKDSGEIMDFMKSKCIKTF